MNNDAFASVLADDTIELKRLLPGPIERVWEYIVNGEKRARWLAGGDDIGEVGEKFTIVFRHGTLSDVEEETPDAYKKSDSPEGISGDCEVVVKNPPHEVAFTWDEEEEDSSIVTFTLTPQADKVLLTVIHRKLKTPEMMAGVSAGWHAHLGIMVDVLEGKPARGFWTTHEILDTQYRKRLKIN